MDVVITYVQPTEQFIELYNNNTKDDELIAPRADGNRFRTYGVLDLQIKLIRKYMPYINNVFVVVSSRDQIPDNFDMSLCKFVFHKEIIPEEYLPLFNSCAIEMFIHKIHDLDEQFVYFNDDMFVISDIPEDFWFKDGKPCLDFDIKDLPTYQWDHTCKKHSYNCTQINAKYFDVQYDYNNQLIEFAHLGRPLLKSTCDTVYEIYHNEIINSLSKLRKENNFNTNLFNNYDIMNENYIQVTYNGVYCINDNIDSIINYLNKKEYQLMCVNDAVWVCFERFVKHFKIALEANLNNETYIREKLREDKIIATLMCSPDNINKCSELLMVLIKYQTYVPDKIVLNLSKKNIKEEDLPKDLLDIINEYPDIIEVYWCEEYTEFNRMMYTLERYPNDIIIPIHNNYCYTADFIETLYNDYIDNGKQNPLSYAKANENTDLIWHGIFNITEAKYYGKYLKELFNDFNYQRSFSYENLLYTLAAKLNNYYYKNGSRYYDGLIIKDVREDFLYSEITTEVSERANEYIKQKYEKTK